MMDRQTALTTLRLSAQADRRDIITAYTRLARRYPLQQFPERHAQLLEAKTALLNPELGFKEMLFEENVDLGWLNHYAAKKETSPDTTHTNKIADSKQLLAALFRPHLKKGLNLLAVPASGADAKFAQALGEIGPEDLEEFMKRFNLL